MLTNYPCISTHGGAGYVTGTFIDEEGRLICGQCHLIIGYVSLGTRLSIGLARLPEWIQDFRTQRKVSKRNES